MVKPMPASRPRRMGSTPEPGENRLRSRPTNRPSHAPEAVAAPNTRRQLSRAWTRSTSIGLTPTMLIPCTGNSLCARWSTARWACW